MVMEEPVKPVIIGRIKGIRYQVVNETTDNRIKCNQSNKDDTENKDEGKGTNEKSLSVESPGQRDKKKVRFACDVTNELSDDVMDDVIENDDERQMTAAVETRAESKKVTKYKPLKVTEMPNLNITTKEVQEIQCKDDTLKRCWDKASHWNDKNRRTDEVLYNKGNSWPYGPNGKKSFKREPFKLIETRDRYMITKDSCESSDIVENKKLYRRQHVDWKNKENNYKRCEIPSKRQNRWMNGRCTDDNEVTRRNVRWNERNVNNDNRRNYKPRSREFNRNNRVDIDRSSRINWRCRDENNIVENTGRCYENKPWYRKTNGSESVRKQRETGGVHHDENKWRGRIWNDRKWSYPEGVVNKRGNNNDCSKETKSLEGVRWKSYGDLDQNSWVERTNRRVVRNSNTLILKKKDSSKTWNSCMDQMSGQDKRGRVVDMRW
jgi:hypothetical protein